MESQERSLDFCSTQKSSPKPNDGAGHNLEGAASLQWSLAIQNTSSLLAFGCYVTYVCFKCLLHVAETCGRWGGSPSRAAVILSFLVCGVSSEPLITCKHYQRAPFASPYQRDCTGLMPRPHQSTKVHSKSKAHCSWLSSRQHPGLVEGLAGASILSPGCSASTGCQMASGWAA